jgi:ATP-dependent RNA helicase DDX24/MAK5
MLQNLGLSTNALHSQMIQKARLRSVERFTAAKPNTTSILVATDVAARGLDIPGVDQVIHYHVPRSADMYVHRSGRTARAENSGISIILCSPEEVIPTRRLTSKVHLEQAGKQKVIKEVDIDRRVVAQLKPRLELAKKIADACLAKEKGNKDEEWMKKAADDLGVDYDSDELDNAGKWGGKGSGRKEKQNELRTITKRELGIMKAQLRDLLSQKINTGVSPKYITGRSDLDELLSAKGDFLGKVDGLGLDDD